MILPVGFGSSAGGTPANAVENSLRFNSADSAYLNRTPASNGNRQTWTLSFWLKLGTLSTNRSFFGAGTNGSNYFLFYLTNGDVIRCEEAVSGVNTWNVVTTPVYRDPSAWYHIVMAFDSPQATSSNRIKLYVNGVQVTAFSTATYPTQNLNSSYWNATSSHNIGAAIAAGVAYGNGYLTEINFIDGQALTPSSFGETDTNTGVWNPKVYTGSYGTNGFYLPMSAGTTWSGYFDGSNDYLSVASNAAWQYGTGDFTVECWLLGTSSGALSNQYPLGRYNTSAGAYGALQIGNSTTIYWYYGNGAAYTFTLGTALTTNQWYHFAVSRSGTSLRFFLNGTQVGSTQTDSTNYSGTAEFRIVNAHQTSATYFPGYISNVRVVKGSAVYTANFTPSTTPLTAITNTVLLTCQSSTFIDNSTNNFTITNNGGAITQLFSPFNYDATDDQSGNGNNWQPNNLNLVTTGVGADSLVDSPTSYGTDTGVGGEVRGNYCTWNPLDKNTNVTINNGNLDAIYTGSADVYGCFSTFSVSSGKWYAEFTATGLGGANYPLIGIRRSSSYQANFLPETYVDLKAGTSTNRGSAGPTFTAFVDGDVLGIAFNADSGEIFFSKNGTFLNSGNPVAGTGEFFSGLTDGPFKFGIGTFSSRTAIANFGQRAFSYTAPSGFKALCTQNLPPVTIGATSTTQANDYFNPVLYTGTGSSLGVTGVGFQPDLVWIKSRSAATDHGWYDAVRGVQLQLESNTTSVETTETTGLTAFGSDGFTVGALAQLNTSSATYVAWNWNAGGSNQTISVGQYATSPANVPSIASTVRANTTSGFSIVTYTGNGTSGATIGHGLGAVPSFYIVKNRGSANKDWECYHISLGNTNRIRLNVTAAADTGGTMWANTTPTNNVFSVGVDADVNASTNTYVAYCFAPVAGYSAFGSYTGNNTNDNAFVYLGFRPEFIMIKCSSTGGINYDWIMFDVARMPYNYIANTDLRANLPSAEGGTSRNPALDILSNGFKVRGSGGEIGQSQTYIYAAFAENPFKYSLAR